MALHNNSDGCPKGQINVSKKGDPECQNFDGTTKKEKGKFLDVLPNVLIGLGGIAGAIWGSKQTSQPTNGNQSIPPQNPSELDEKKGAKIWLIIGGVFIVAAIIFAIIKYTKK